MAGAALSTRLPATPTASAALTPTSVPQKADTAPKTQLAKTSKSSGQALPAGIVTKDGWQVVAEPRTIEQIAPKSAPATPASETAETRAEPLAAAPTLADLNQANDGATIQPIDSKSPPPKPKPNASASARVVCIDPGHPSETSDGANSHGLSENRLNWQVALELKTALEKLGVRCVMTKSREKQVVTNRERATIANNANAELFLRLHCDEGAGRGWRWYYPDRSGKKYGVSGPPQNVQRASGRAAKILNESMKGSIYLRGYLKSNPVTTDASTFVGGKQGGVLTGSIFARVPTALIEMCFINQKSDAQFIASESGRKRMAYALAVAIRAYLDQTPTGSWK